MSNIVDRLRLRFESGNSVPVERIHITASEFSEIERLRAQAAGWVEQHHRDSAELRELCAARDEARRERDALKARIKESPTAVAQREHYGGCVLYGPEELDGKRVALVQLGG